MNEATQPELATSPTEVTPLQKASRFKRLLAAIIDGITIMLVTIPAMFLTGGFSEIANGVEPSWVYSAVLGLLGIAIFLLINFNFLKTSGQTLGKKALDIKVVTSAGELPTMEGHFLKRYAMYFLPGYVPLGGQLVSLVNVLFIFGKEKRCIHDYVADTIVVDC